MKTFVMLDTETLALTPDVIVMSIGAVAYDAQQGMFSTFEAFPDMTEQCRAGRKLDGETLKWWFKQSDAARLAIANSTSEHAEWIALRLRDWMNKLCETRNRQDIFFMANGNDFDLPVVSTLLSPHVQVPWDGNPGFRQKICWRTLTVLFKDKLQYPKNTVPHDALHDAITQAETHLNLLRHFPEFT